MRLIGAVLFACVSGFFLLWFNRLAVAKFRYQFFGRSKCLTLCAAVVLLGAGGAISGKHAQYSEQIELVLFVAGGVLLWWSLFENFLRTNIIYGTVGAALQLLLLVTFFSTGVFIMFLVGGFLFVVFSVVQPVFVVNRRQRRN